ncbi:TRADD-N-associated membrane domain-containing protein (plasmid) [Nocardia sp. CA-129566]|uniref:TRADD-N-associated membrane domain-containing protein n=1 Tax=Nocardia sp. CA-129566 TaxID=3239976 RepID=UPI003D961F06
MWEFALWGAAGAVAYSAVMFLEGTRRTKEWPWEDGSGAIYALAVFIRCVLGAGLAFAVAAAVPDLPPTAGAVFGVAAPLFITQLAAGVGSLATEADQVRDDIAKGVTPRPQTIINVSEGASVDTITSFVPDTEAARVSESMEKQEAILREMYTQGLAQARNSFRISLTFAVIGATVLLIGIGLAIWNAPGTGDRYASIVASTAGIVINLTASLFFVQSNRARRSMLEQGALLREESRDDRRLSAARELAAAITNEAQRNNIRAQLALTLLAVPAVSAMSSEAEADRPRPEGDTASTQVE